MRIDGILIYLRYAWYVLQHKFWVCWYAHRVGASFWLCLMHDTSKFSRAEFGAYARWFKGKHGKSDVCADAILNGHCTTREANKAMFQQAWSHHFTHNKHHPEYWQRDAHGYAIPMPECYVREMIADWMGAGRAITGTMDVHEWWLLNHERFTPPINMHETTYRRVEQFMGQL